LCVPIYVCVCVCVRAWNVIATTKVHRIYFRLRCILNTARYICALNNNYIMVYVYGARAGCEGNWKYLFNWGNGFGAQPLDKWPINVQGGRGGVYAAVAVRAARTIRRETRNNWRTTRKFRNAHLAIIYYYYIPLLPLLPLLYPAIFQSIYFKTAPPPSAVF